MKMIKILKGASLFDGTGKDLIEDSILIIDEKGRILDVGDSKAINILQYKNTEIFDLTGKYLLPGLIDAHVHIGYHGLHNTYDENFFDDKLRAIRAVKEMENTINAGFTTVRNCGSVNQLDFFVKESVEKGYINGPRILTSGKILSITCSGTDYFKGLYRIADGYDQFKKAAREQLEMGADILKVMATGAVMNPGGVPGAEQPDLKELQAVVEEGRKLGKRVAAHAHGNVGIKNAIKAGVATIEHGSFADDDTIEMMIDNNIYLITTLIVGHLLLIHGEENGIPEFMLNKQKELRSLRLNTIKKAVEKGVKITMGSDAGVSPYNYHGKNACEMVCYVNEGLMNPKDAVISATKIAAEACGLDKELGTLEKGKVADLIVLDADPFENIETLIDSNNVKIVMKEGQILKNINK
jgi:imidazolonepropionase-like amidohydrolase